MSLNAFLPADKKIRVIAIAKHWNKSDPCLREIDELNAAIEVAAQAGVFVVAVNIDEAYSAGSAPFSFLALGRNPLSNPNGFSSYETGAFFANEFYENPSIFDPSSTLLVPMDSRAVASPTGKSEYVFYREGGLSWAVPYIAGVYALAVDADPNITPSKFWEYSLDTGKTIKFWHDGKTYSLGRIMDPYALIKKLLKEQGAVRAIQQAPSIPKDVLQQ